jgi:hypothetical protein
MLYIYDNTYYILNYSESLDISQVKILRALEKFNPERFKFICTTIRFYHRCIYPKHRHNDFHTFTCLRFQDTPINGTLEYPEIDEKVIENWKKRRIQ